MSKSTNTPRANYIGAPEYFILNQLCCILVESFGLCTYLVGSSITSLDFRDVDIRTILDDEEFDKLFKDNTTTHNPFWSLLCISVSEYLSSKSGLKVDYQIQRRTETNKTYNGSRQAIGFFIQKKTN